jgi:hypothetical protein
VLASRKGANPRFIVASLPAGRDGEPNQRVPARPLGRPRGARDDGGCGSPSVRRLGLQRSELAKATAGTIRLKLLKIGAVVTVSVRRIKIAFATTCPAKTILVLAPSRLRSIGLKARL